MVSSIDSSVVMFVVMLSDVVGILEVGAALLDEVVDEDDPPDD